jgi:pyruvate dehydrogenase E1 component alpha subunit
MDSSTATAANRREMTKKKDRRGRMGQDLDRNEMHGFLKSMILQRVLEEAVGEAYALGKVGGFCHLYIGQEAVSTGALAALRKDDYLITTYRDHGQALVRGISARAIMAELFGRVDGCSRGKGGSMHLFDRDLNFLGGHGIVGAHVPLAAGVGFAIKYRGNDQVCFCFMGESVVNGGAFHETLNICSVWKLPVVFLIENNRYGMGTDISRVSSIEILARRGDAYQMKNESVDGQDVLAVREVVQRAVNHARSDQSPFLIEARTHRFRGHSMSDAASGTYRSKEELEENMRRDPIEIFRRRLTDEGLLADTDFRQMEAEAKAIVDDAVEFAEQSPEPPPEALFEDVLV